MKLSPRVQMLVDQIVQELKLQACRPSALHIDMDDRGLVQCVTPELTYRREKGLDNGAHGAHS